MTGFDQKYSHIHRNTTWKLTGRSGVGPALQSDSTYINYMTTKILPDVICAQYSFFDRI